MIAVAVAMSVIIFMWSQGFLSQTSSATGGQQGAQNQAAQSSISIELGTFTKNSTAGWASGKGPQMQIVVRNVGAVAINIGSVTVSGISSNVGFKGSVITTISTGTVTPATSDGTTWTASPSGVAAWTTSTPGYLTIPKGSALTITLTGTAAPSPAVTKTWLTSGDIVNIKVTTAVGTFAQAQFTVP